MDRQQAIWLIKDHMEHHKIGEYPHILLGEALNMAIAALSQPNDPLTCAGCYYLDEQCAPCAHCMRANGYADYYRRPPEGEEGDADRG